jgi:hypothetical protein
MAAHSLSVAGSAHRRWRNRIIPAATGGAARWLKMHDYAKIMHGQNRHRDWLKITHLCRFLPNLLTS